MQGDSIEIRYFHRNTGYVTETFHNTSTQGAMNAVKARVGPDVTFSSMKFHSAPPPNTQPDSSRDSSRR